MFDVAPTELLLVGAVALIVIGPKDLPATMRTVGRWVGKARGVASHFRSGFDQMVREAELEEMEKRWAEENKRIMREHPPEPDAALPPPEPAPADGTTASDEASADDPVSRDNGWPEHIDDAPQSAPRPAPQPAPSIAPPLP